MHESYLSQAATERLRNNPELRALVPQDAARDIWQPFPGPQQQAYSSAADWIGYGGAAGSGKTDLALGLAGQKHERSLVLRKLYPSMEGMISRSREIFNASGVDRTRDSYNESLHRWRLRDGRMVQFGSLQYPGDWQKYRGNPYDFHVFDEATEFTESVVRSITAWNRTTARDQHCQVLLTFNPPTEESGRWIISFFLPWMAYLFPKLEECKGYTGVPARPGELRYFIRTDKGDKEVPEGTAGAKSRTFFPANVGDNPVLIDQGYAATLEALPEPLRSQLRHGDFMAGTSADAWQVIPTAWVLAAMERWTDSPPQGLQQSGLGVDVARGGNDQTVIAERWGQWYNALYSYPGKDTPTGNAVAEIVERIVLSDHDPLVTVDIIGVGGSAYDQLSPIVRVNPFNASAGAGDVTDQATGRLRFGNERARAWWQMREALDPRTGDDIALPPDAELRAELCSPRYMLRTGRLWVEEKDMIRKRLGRSTDKADAVIMAREDSPGLLLWDNP